MAADSDKNKMSRLLNLARKFNCFYLSGKMKKITVKKLCVKNDEFLIEKQMADAI